ncbi:MAG: hypothetical protein ACR2L4_06265 [Actinomycetota bacterium]
MGELLGLRQALVHDRELRRAQVDPLFEVGGSFLEGAPRTKAPPTIAAKKKDVSATVALNA